MPGNCKDVDAMFEEMTEDSILQKCGTTQIQGLDAWGEYYEFSKQREYG
jgi:hypothetical protein